MVSEHEWLHGKPYEEAFADGDVAWSDEALKGDVERLQELAASLRAERDRELQKAAWKLGFETGMWAVTTGATGEKNPYGR